MAAHVEAPSTAIFTLFYIVFTLGFYFQSREFVGLGLSPDFLLSARDWLGSEQIRFVDYHLKRSAGAMVLYSLLPCGYMYSYSYFSGVVDGRHSSVLTFWASSSQTFQALMALSVLLPLGLASLVWFWSYTDWESHPFVRKMKIYSGENWRGLAADLSTEFRRFDKMSIQTNPQERVVVTDSWILLLGLWPWSMHLSHQSDSSLQLVNSDNHSISTEGELGGTQYLRIEVISRKPGVNPFRFRLNSLDYQNLQDKLEQPIQNIKNIQIYKTVSERFVEVFKETISQNPRVAAPEGLEPCIGCWMVTSNVKLNRVCESSQAEGGEDSDRCVNCYCRPMWCIDYLAKWFASRQDQSQPETWLGSKCPCPTCRSKFCVLDVCLLE